MLKANHDELIKGGGDDFEKIGVINRMSRILFVSLPFIPVEVFK